MTNTDERIREKQHDNERHMQIAAARLPEIERELIELLQQANDAAREALEAGNIAGGLLHEAQVLCENSKTNYRQWLQERIHMNRERARTLIELHINWNDIRDRLNNQMLFDFGGVRKMLTDEGGEKDRIGGSVFDNTIEIPESAYDVPETLSVGFEYPDEGEDTNNSTKGHDAAISAVESLYRYVIPRRLEKREDWRTCLVRFVGTAFLLGVMPDNVSMRDACAALGVSHATVSKYVRQLADATGIRSPIMKREGARKVYSDVQTANHWRNRDKYKEAANY